MIEFKMNCDSCYEVSVFCSGQVSKLRSMSCVFVSDVSACSGGSGSYRDDPAGPTAGLAEPVPCDDMPAVSGAAGGRGA